MRFQRGRKENEARKRSVFAYQDEERWRKEKE